MVTSIFNLMTHKKVPDTKRSDDGVSEILQGAATK